MTGRRWARGVARADAKAPENRRFRGPSRLLGGVSALLAPIAVVSAAPDGPCTQAGGVWDDAARLCTVTRDTDTGPVKISASYPVDLIDDPGAGPVLRSFLSAFFDRYPPAKVASAGTVTLTDSVFTGPRDTTSVAFSGSRFFKTMPHPVEWVDTFTFDLASQRQLQLGDLVCPGADPLTVIPLLVRSQVQQRIGSVPGVSNVTDWEPGGRFADNYQAWVVDGTNLVLYLPASRGPGGIPPAWVKPSVPLASLRANCST